MIAALFTRAAGIRGLATVLGAALLSACAGTAAPRNAPAATGARTAADASPTAAAAGEAAGGTRSVDVVLLGTTDVHGRLHNHDYYTGTRTDHGLALLKPLVDSVRTAHPGRVLLFDSGDLLQGNPLGLVYARQYAAQPSPIVHAMNLLGYDAAAIGNHEFNYGIPHLERAAEQAAFPFISANIFRHGTNDHAFAPYALISVAVEGGDSLIVGVTGNTPPGVHVWDRQHVTGVLEFRDVVTSVRPVVAEMRARGADVVVVLSHGGLEGTSYDTLTTGLPAENAAAELARQEPGIDVIFMGHTHREVADTVINGVLLAQAKNWGASLAAVSLTAERAQGGRWRVASKRGEILRPDVARADVAFEDSLRWAHERTVAWVNARIGTSTEHMPAREARVRDTPIIDFINEVQRRAAGAQLAASAAFQIDAGLPAGDVTIADVAALYPYDNTLKAIRISGSQLRAYLEKSAEYYAGFPAAAGGTVTNFAVPGYNFDIVSGVDYTLDISRPVGSRVTALSYEGNPVRDDDSFTLALNNYRQSGGGGYDMIAGAEVIYDEGEDVRELLIEEIRRRGTIRPGDFFRESWRLVPAAAVDVALAEQTSREVRSTAADRTNGTATRLRVLTLNDFHGRLEPMRPSWAQGREVGGAAALATYFRLEGEGFGGPVVMLHGGDVMQGTPLSNLTRGRATIEFHNMIGWHGGAFGNHEFDWGTDVLRERIAQSQFPWLAANIHVAGTDTTPGWVRDTATIVVDGVRVGVIGLITEETGQKTMAEYVAGLAFVDGAAMIDRWVPELRRAGVDFVIVVAHEGGRCDAEMTRCEGPLLEWAQRLTHRPDLMIGGHTHELVRWRENGVPIVEAAMWGTHYGVVDIERVTPDSAHVRIRGTPVAWTDQVQPDADVAALVARTAEEVGPQLARVIAHAAEPLERGGGDSGMGMLIADAQRWKAAAQIAFMNTGGVRAPLQAGPVTWGDLYQVHPFGNMLVVLELRGADLREALEHAVRRDDPNNIDGHISGMVVTFDGSRPPGSRVVALQLQDGTPITDDVVYRVVVNDFLASGVGDGYAPFARAISETPTGASDLDALIEYIQQMPQPVRAPQDTRFRQVQQ